MSSNTQTMCGIIRFYCEKNGVQWLEDMTPDEVKSTRRRLRRIGARVTHIALL